MAKVDERVFCNKCDWYKRKIQMCEYPPNIVKEATWVGLKRVYLLHASKKNKTNNCPDYSPRKWWRSLWRR